MIQGRWINIFIKFFNLAGDQQEPNKDQKPNKIKEEKEASGFLVGGAGFIPTAKSRHNSIIRNADYTRH